jgi:hypothetical protein
MASEIVQTYYSFILKFSPIGDSEAALLGNYKNNEKQRQESDTIVPYYSSYPKAVFFFSFSLSSLQVQNYSRETKAPTYL